MLTLFYIIIFIELLTVFYNLFKFLLYKLFSSSNKQHNNVKNSNNDFHINVLIPCYNEISIISNTLNYFEKISQIPRGSGNEKAISDYLCKKLIEFIINI